jgi:hypothetical protein
MQELGVPSCFAIVLEGLTKIEEADLFVKKQYGRKSLSIWELFTAEKVATHEDVLTIIRVVTKCGYVISAANGHNHIVAVGALRRIYRMGGPELLAVTLQTTGSLWSTAEGQDGSVSRQGIILHGLAIFLHSFRGLPGYDPKRTQNILVKNSPGKFLRWAQEIAMTRRTTESSAVNVAEAIRNAYNNGLGKGKKLDAIRQSRRSPKRPSEKKAPA